MLVILANIIYHMRKVILVANWKQSGKREEVLTWIEKFDKERSVLSADTQVIVCPPLKALDLVAQTLVDKSLPIAVGLQDVDLPLFEGEKNTGEVGADLLTDSAAYAIVGHSETRKNRSLTDEDVAKKVRLAKANNFTPIVCISELNQVTTLKNLLGGFTDILAYEPLFAIGSGNPDTPKNAESVAKQTHAIFPRSTVLYGGSVDGGNVKEFLNQEHISGVLVGNRSLEPAFFLRIVKNAH